jgi:transaldolase
LAARGARLQRPLSASTRAKNPEYSDVLYVDEWIGPDAVNTLQGGTLDAFVDHDHDHDTDDAEVDWAALLGVGVDTNDVAALPEREGAASFAKAFDELIEALKSKAVGLENRSARR